MKSAYFTGQTLGMKIKSLSLFRLIIPLVFVCCLSTVQAQTPDRFSRDSTAFFEEMDAYLSNARKEGKGFMKQFQEVWYGGYFSEKQRQGVYSVTNTMLKKKLRAFPDFRNYLFTVGSFVVDTNQTEESFEAWQGIIFELLKLKRKRNFTDFLDFCNELFRENAMYYSASTIWSASNSNYLFAYDSLPKITFESLDLICFAKRDSMIVYDTKGAYYPTTKTWVGHGGKVYWTRAGFAEKDVYAEISNYKIDAKVSTYEADSVIFHNKFYFDAPLVGKLTDKLLANVTEERATYPKFDSYDKRIIIENISPGVNFDGGFSMAGSKLIGKGDEEQDAVVEFVRNDTVFLRSYSENFSIRKDRIISNKASINIYLGQDSISHPGLDFKYLFEEKLVTLYKDGKGISKTPYYNTFHNIDMDFEVLNWKTNEPILEFTKLIGSTKTDARFTSANYFKKELFEKLGGGANNNPLTIINGLARQYNSEEISFMELCQSLNMDPRDVQNMIIQYSNFGLVDFDFKNDKVFVKDKLFEYVQAYSRKIDYDVININSGIEGSRNAKLNLLNYDLSIYGVRGIVLSDSQKVVILPAGGLIKMKRNRYFEFGGLVKAGRFDFYGKEFAFDYENFKIDLINVDSLKLKAESTELDRQGKLIIKPVKTVIEGINGDLLIDNFGNKSGLKDFPGYPIFNSREKSYVYYNKKEVLDGVYHKSDFYFELKPFTVDSLNSFGNDQLTFDGTFASANIFPEFEEKLTLQEDFSLGFIRPTPTAGMPMYRGKGTFYDDIKLSHKGLRGDGKLEYITSTTYSNDFIFYPDSMITNASEYFVDKQKGSVQYPPAKAEKTDMRWLPKQDVMFATTTESEMILYDPKDSFDGTTAYGPKEMTAGGTYHFERANLESNKMIFKYNTFDADTSDFQLKSEEVNELALQTKDVKAHVDYVDRFASFKANGISEPIFFPVNNYLCYMEEFKWYMDNGVIELTSTRSNEDAADVELEGSRFVSTHPDQDSLYFYSPIATYDSRRHKISAEDVLYINSADARIYPDSGKVVVKRAAVMDPLKDSRIVTNSITEFHEVYGANTIIKGRKDYISSGNIDYVDETGFVQTIYLYNITVDEGGQSVGKGNISDTTTFTLSPYFVFDGKVKLFGSKQFLVFDGVTKINHECTKLEKRWIDFEAEIDPNNVFIPIDTNLRDLSGAFIATGINLNIDSIFMYPGFLTKRVNYSDIPIIEVLGFLHYDKASKEYRLGEKEKIAEQSLAGNYLSLSTEVCKVYGEGKIDIGVRAGNLTFNSAGNVVYTLEDDGSVLDLMTIVDFFFDDNLIKKMADDINENINLNPVDLSRTTYTKGLKEILGTERADKIVSQLSLNGKIKKLPDELNKRLVFSDVKFKWNEDLNAFKSFGPLGITNANKHVINKYVGGGIMITKKRSGDIINIYLEIDAKNWYYFSYRRGLMKVISSNAAFNTHIREMKKDKRRYSNAKGEKPFTFMYGVEKEVRDFKRDFESDL
ncbi:MAG: hypothetical protein JKY48_18680 [Flavobacteriales bacterium]|nr:hypothetical protein [Flavobacteriales bacterium]